MQQSTPNQQWHMAEWGTWGWAETILKLIGLAAGIIAFVRSLSAGNGLIIGGNQHLAAVIVLVLLTLASIAQLAIRWQQHETVSFGFAVVNLLGHLGLLISLLLVPAERTLPLVFGIFFILGQLTKIQFLRVTGYTEGGANASGMLRTTGIIAVLYLVLVIFILL